MDTVSIMHMISQRCPHNLFIDELYSITVEIEAILNSRPLTPLDSAQDDGIEVRSPGHFLVGKALKSVPAPDIYYGYYYYRPSSLKVVCLCMHVCMYVCIYNIHSSPC